MSRDIIPFGIGLPIPTRRTRHSAIDPIAAMLAPFDATEGALADAMDGFKVDIKETEDGYEVKADFPGVDKGDVNVKIEDDVLTISYEDKHEDGEKDENGEWIRHERTYSSMKRSFTLPNADEEKAKASMTDGVLEIEIPKKEHSDTSKTIEIS